MLPADTGKICDRKTLLNHLEMEGLIKTETVDANLLNVALEDLLIMPANLNGVDVYLPGPAFGLNRQPVYVSSDSSGKNKHASCRALTHIIEFDGTSLNAARNIFLLNTFKQISDVKSLINGGNYEEAYRLIRAIEYKLNLIKIYYGNDKSYLEIERNILALKRKMEIENNIFLMPHK